MPRRWRNMKKISQVSSSKILKRGGLVVAALAVVGLGAAIFMTLQDGSSEPDAPTYVQSLDNELSSAQAAVRDIGNPQTKEERAEAAEKYNDLGAAYYNVGDPRAAVSAYNNAIAVSPERKQYALPGLIYAYHAVGENDKAILATEEYLDIQRKLPDDVESQGRIQAYTTVLNSLKAGGEI